MMFPVVSSAGTASRPQRSKQEKETQKMMTETLLEIIDTDLSEIKRVCDGI
jgi:hypothetical protein